MPVRLFVLTGWLGEGGNSDRSGLCKLRKFRHYIGKCVCIKGIKQYRYVLNIILIIGKEPQIN